MSTPLSKAANQFAVDLFQCYLSRHGDKYRNLLLCPYLIYHSLAMMLVGAKGNTEKQLLKVLHIPQLKDLNQVDRPKPSDRICYLNRSPSLGSNSSSSSVASSLNSSHSSISSNSVQLSRTGSCKRRNAGAKSLSSLTGQSGGNKGGQKSVKIREDATSKRARQSRRENSQSNKSVGGSKLHATKSDQSQGKVRQLTPDGPNEARHRQFLMLTEQLLHGNHDFVHLASFIYLDKGTKRTERYKAILRDYYETKPKKIDFDNIDLMVKTINEDVARTTENIYHDILSRQEAQKLEKSYMLLVNAVFFRGFWLSNFTDVKQAPFIKYPAPPRERSRGKTRDQLASGQTPAGQAKQASSPHQSSSSSQQQQQEQPVTYNVNMMSKLDYLPVVSDEDLDARIIKMPFEASDLQMLLILPNNRQCDSTYLCEKINAAKINNMVEQFDKTKSKTLRVTMPIFCIDSGKISIQSTLMTMGASDLFDKTKADMGGVCENKQIWLHKVIHRCFIVCDNRGSITSSGFEKARRRGMSQVQSDQSKGGGVEEFVADHPFMYIIMDSVTKTILLIGLYTDPSETLEVINESKLSPEEAHQIYTEGVYKT